LILIRVPIATFLCIALFSCNAFRRVPEWSVGSGGFCGSFEAATLIAIGRLSEIQRFATERIERPPWPVQPVFKTVYWCSGRLRIHRVLKGQFSGSEGRLVWGTVRPCETDLGHYGRLDGDTQVWFLRQEGRWLRPTVDLGGPYYVAFNAPEQAFLGPDPIATIGRLLLKPEAIADSDAQFATVLSPLATNACCVLGVASCRTALTELLSHPDAAVRDAAATYIGTIRVRKF
jgi:hypothetical protein